MQISLQDYLNARPEVPSQPKGSGGMPPLETFELLFAKDAI